MQVVVPGKEMSRECNADYVSDLFPWVRERIEAYQELKRMRHDTALISNHGRQLLRKGGNWYEAGWVPDPIWDELMVITHGEFATNKKMQEEWLRQNPHFSSRDRR